MAKGKGGNVTGIVEALARPVVEELGYRLWDVRYEKEGPDWFLRIFIDKDGYMDTSDCEQVSRALDPLIDAADPIAEGYFFEVSSPGLGRKLARQEHFAAVLGEKVAVRLFHADVSGSKEVNGILTAAAAGTITVRTDEGEKVIAQSEISIAKLCDDEDLFAAQ
ncbi:MAG: ribosome maturation factor RimP [Pygmaiobacter sp.]